MPSTGKRGPRRDNRLPLEIYNSLPHHKKVICWYYFLGIQTGGTEGWRAEEAGSAYHFRSSTIVKSHPDATQSWFRHIARSMVTLAKAIAENNQRPTKPEGVPDSFATKSPQPPPVPNLDSSNGLLSKMQSPPFTPGGRIAHEPEPSDLVVDHGMTCPTSSGHFMKFDYTNRRETQIVMNRVLVHGAVDSNQVEFEWIHSKKLKYRIAWPDFFQYPEQMANFCVDDEGNVKYGPDHPLTWKFASNNKKLQDEDGKIWDTGFLHFTKHMKTDLEDLSFEVLRFDIPSQDTVVKMLQIETR
jgi:hypothetical protein